MATASLTVSFPCGLTGFHVYKDIWNPVLGEEFVLFMKDNLYDHFAIATRKQLPGSLLIESTVRHLPKETSRIT